MNRLSRAHERYRRQTDGRAIAYSEREREFTFAKNVNVSSRSLKMSINCGKFKNIFILFMSSQQYVKLNSLNLPNYVVDWRVILHRVSKKRPTFDLL